MEVYKAIVAVQGDLASIGIKKEKKNQQQGYSFRGIDDVYDVLAPALAKHKLCIIPTVLDRQVVERLTKSGNALFYVTVTVDFALVSAEDGSTHVGRTYGEAMDSADKATNKAMSAAYKYFAFQTFCIPVDVAEDADTQTHEVKPLNRPPSADRGHSDDVPEPKLPPKPKTDIGNLETKTTYLKGVEIKEGVSKTTNKPWKRVDITDEDGALYGTFDLKLEDKAKDAIFRAVLAKVMFQKGKTGGNNLIALEVENYEAA